MSKQNKSILIIDTPSSCSKCKLAYDEIDCFITGESLWNKDNNPDTQILSNCPLSPIPEKRNFKLDINDIKVVDVGRMVAYQYAQGWNDCIDQIKKGEITNAEN